VGILRVTLLASLLAARAAIGIADVDDGDEAGGRFEATSTHSFEDVGHWVRVFDDPARAEWQKPAELVAALGLKSDMRVADLGAGTGYFSRHLSTAVGPGGTVFAVDVEPALVVHLLKRAEREGTANVVPVLASADDPRLPARLLDLVLIVDTYHHLDDRLEYLKRLAASLARDGRVAIVDWKKQEAPVGPPDLDHKLARDQVVSEMEAAGFTLSAGLDLLPYQYVLIFARD
jgi:predicted methyltransferase